MVQEGPPPEVPPESDPQADQAAIAIERDIGRLDELEHP